MMTGPETRNITRRLLAWYDKNSRDLPWRKTHDPYAIWVSEIMLQQTQVDTVIPYFRRFLKRFPTIQRLARASREGVLKSWENLGYYARARHLHEAAGQVVDIHGGELPATPEGLLSLPGIGVYTAGAILSIAFEKPVPAIDGNVRRVMSRLMALRKPLREPSVQKKIEKAAQALLPQDRPGQFNQALMDLGATVCLPRNPACGRCPLTGACLARSRGLQNDIPPVPKRATLPHRDMTAGIIRKNGRVLVVRRPEKGLLGGLWKFPGGRREDGLSLQRGLRQSIHGEVGIDVAVGRKLLSVEHGFTHFLVTLHVYSCRHLKGRPKALGCAEWAWAPVERLGNLAFSKADRVIIRALFETHSKT
ncbi:MAG: A/G-specific adenine glycosylase [Deltaproteobacteria bacterium]|nr:A/G-specific adenine glycosylase [Deltaproteobacteria bacterium]